MKPDSTAAAPEFTEVRKGLWKVKVPHPKGTFKIAQGKKHAENILYLEVSGARKFEVGDDSDANHFWFKCLQEPRTFAQKNVVNLPKSLSIPRPLDAKLIKEFGPVLEMMDKGDHYVFSYSANLIGPFRSDDESSYFFNSEFLELWDIEDPAAEDVLSDWEHYESKTPRLFRQGDVMDKQYDIIVPMVPQRRLKQENINLYHQMIKSGDRPPILLYGMLQRPVPQPVRTGHSKNTHSYFAGFVLDGHHKLSAYQRAGVPANCLVVLSPKASKYKTLEGESGGVKARLEERLAAIANKGG